ncbi:hypothetical protein NL108_002027, partial [Boleophthalmus pectinirostris]
NFIELFHKKLQKRELILRDELKLLLHLCQSPDDMVVARDAIYRYHAENLNFAHGEFRFGPLFMRLCYELGLEEMAAATIKDKVMCFTLLKYISTDTKRHYFLSIQRLEGFFNDSTSFNIAIDMLFTKGAYESALDILRTMQIYNIPFNKDTLILAFGTCYKLNTPESYKICTTLIEESQSKGHLIPRQAYCFAIALALEQVRFLSTCCLILRNIFSNALCIFLQNYTDTAQSLYSQIMNAEGRLCKNLKATKSGELEELTSVFYAALHKTPAFIKKPEFTQDV